MSGAVPATGTPAQRLEEVARAQVHVQRLEAGTYDENADGFLRMDLYECAVTLDRDLAALEARCAVHHPKAPQHTVDIRALVAHKLSTLLWINAMPRLRQKRLVCLGLADKERTRVAVPQASGTTAEAEVAVSLRGELQLSTLLLAQPGLFREVRRNYCIAVPDWRGSGHCLRVVQVTGGCRRAVLRFDMDVAPGRPRLEQFDGASLSAEHRRFYKFFNACTVARILDGLGALPLPPRDGLSPRSGTPPLSPAAITQLDGSFAKSYSTFPDERASEVPTDDVSSASDASRPASASEPSTDARCLAYVCDLLALEGGSIASGAQPGEPSALWAAFIYGAPLPVSAFLFLAGWDVVAVLLGIAATGALGVVTAVVAALWPELTETEMVEDLSWYCEPHPLDNAVMHCFLAMVTKAQYYCVEQVDRTVHVKPYADFDAILADRRSSQRPQLYAHAQAARDTNDQPCVSLAHVRRAAAPKANSVAFAQELFRYCCQRNKAAPSRPWWLSTTGAASAPATPSSAGAGRASLQEKRQHGRGSSLSVRLPSPPPGMHRSFSPTSASSFRSCVSPLPSVTPPSCLVCPNPFPPPSAMGSPTSAPSSRPRFHIPDVALATMPVPMAERGPSAPDPVPGPAPGLRPVDPLSPPRGLPAAPHAPAPAPGPGPGPGPPRPPRPLLLPPPAEFLAAPRISWSPSSSASSSAAPPLLPPFSSAPIASSHSSASALTPLAPPSPPSSPCPRTPVTALTSVGTAGSLDGSYLWAEVLDDPFAELMAEQPPPAQVAVVEAAAERACDGGKAPGAEVPFRHLTPPLGSRACGVLAVEA